MPGADRKVRPFLVGEIAYPTWNPFRRDLRELASPAVDVSDGQIVDNALRGAPKENALWI